MPGPAGRTPSAGTSRSACWSRWTTRCAPSSRPSIASTPSWPAPSAIAPDPTERKRRPMSTTTLAARQRALLHELAQIAAERAGSEPALADSFRAENERAGQAFHEAREALEQRLAADREALAADLRRSGEAIEGRAAAEREATQKAHSQARADLSAQFEAEQEAAEAAVQQVRWAADAILDGAKTEAGTHLHENNARLAADVEQLQAVAEQARVLLDSWD